eukprot:6181937-Pleurochrysis_carterae.AAC.1
MASSECEMHEAEKMRLVVASYRCCLFTARTPQEALDTLPTENIVKSASAESISPSPSSSSLGQSSHSDLTSRSEPELARPISDGERVEMRKLLRTIDALAMKPAKARRLVCTISLLSCVGREPSHMNDK